MFVYKFSTNIILYLTYSKYGNFLLWMGGLLWLGLLSMSYRYNWYEFVLLKVFLDGCNIETSPSNRQCHNIRQCYNNRQCHNIRQCHNNRKCHNIRQCHNNRQCHNIRQCYNNRQCHNTPSHLVLRCHYQ